jgi:hypothetical protein
MGDGTGALLLGIPRIVVYPPCYSALLINSETRTGETAERSRYASGQVAYVITRISRYAGANGILTGIRSTRTFNAVSHQGEENALAAGGVETDR